MIVKSFCVMLGSKCCPGHPQLRWDHVGLFYCGFNKEGKQGDLW